MARMRRMFRMGKMVGMEKMVGMGRMVGDASRNRMDSIEVTSSELQRYRIITQFNPNFYYGR